jgi:1,2-diacylglycerol-3-alpha-glucose alpha-1,2-galactosyltransferase
LHFKLELNHFFTIPKVMKIHMISETAFVTKGQGVDTAFVELVELLREKDDIEVVINNEGTGDLLHSHTYGPYYFWTGRKYKGRRILTVHVIPDSIKGSLPMWRRLLPLAKAYFKMVYSYADMLIALSPVVENTIKDLGVRTPIVKIYNPISVDQWKRTPENRKKGRTLLKLSETDIVILGVGQLQERKGVEDFIDIAKALPDCKFVWTGGRPFGIFTEGINRINDKIERAPRNIHFAGQHKLTDMPAIYAAADVFLFPSFQENCPLAPLEAAASGMPVIFRDLKEYTLLYKNPYLKASNKADFIALTKRLINDKRFYIDAIEISTKLIEQFDKNIIRSELIDLYKQVISIY